MRGKLLRTERFRVRSWPGRDSPRQSVAQDVDSRYVCQVGLGSGPAEQESRAPLDEGGVTWTGAETSPKPVEGASVAVMPCPLSLGVCQYLFESAKEAAEAIGWEAFPIDNKGDPAVAQGAVDAAINRGVSCVLTLASPARDIRAQIQRGKERGRGFVTGFLRRSDRVRRRHRLRPLL